MRNHIFVSSIILLSTAGLVILAISGASAATYAFGVKVGDFVKYAPSAAFSSNVSSTPKPEFIMDFQAGRSLRLDVQSISGNNATEKLTESFNNGTVSDRVQFVNWDIQTLQGNASGSQGPTLGSIPFLISGGLTAGDKLCPGTNSMCALTINQTQTVMSTPMTMPVYAGVSRDINLISMAMKSPQFNSTIAEYWDKPTGALVVYLLLVTSSMMPGQKQTYVIGLVATDTSLWPATILGLSPLVFYGIIAATAIIVATAVVLVALRMRKTKAAAPPDRSVICSHS